MILQNMIENIKTVFPRATESMIIKELDVAQKKFVDRTRILQAVGELSGITSYISFSLPNDFKSLKRINYYDANDDPIYAEELDIAAEVHDVNGSKRLTFRSITLTPLSALPTTIGSIQIEYYKIPETLTTRSSTVSIDEKYWEVLELMAMVKFYKMFPSQMEVNGRVFSSIDWRAINSIGQLIRRFELEAEIERNVGYDDRDYEIQFYPHAGVQYTALRSKVTGGIIQIEGGEVAYTKYYRILVNDDNTYEVQQTSGFGTINVAVVAATPVITITSPSNEFTSDPATWVRNNQDMRYTATTGQITITPWSGTWGSVEIEIFIY